ncbi:MAG: Calcium-transporting ATPase 1 [Chlamydiae bacterium]|nr:Calcium-transporting ATPase 1 [Chlamydiota bacterium]
MPGIVTLTGGITFIGISAKVVCEASIISHFQHAVVKIGQFLIFFTLFVATIILIYSFVQIKVTDTLKESLGDVFIFILILVIAGIPVALPAVLSTTLAIGANHLAKLKAIVSKLSAIEELAGMDILCSDKTGTLTKNELTIHGILPYGDVQKEDVLLFACLASSKEGGDTIDDVLLKNLENKDALKEYQLEKFLPFDPTNKKTEATLKDKNGNTLVISKGAPQVILELCDLPDKDKVHAQIEELAGQGLRTLGVSSSAKFLGLIALYDPPREDTKPTIEKIRSMGVSIKMVTGDHTAIAKVIAKELDIGTNIRPMKEVFSDQIPEKEQEKILESADGFAEVYPEHKFELVKYFQERKHIVGMTGDGVNDAPALKQADIGVAVSNATDAARAAADLVLTEPGLMVITRAIEEARHIFGRMKSYAMYRISETVRLLLFLFLAILFFHTHPLTAIMIVIIALLNDIPIMMIAYDHMAVSPKPYSWDMREVLFIAIGLATVGVLSTFGLFWIGKEVWQLGIEKTRTLAFMAILCGGNLTIYLTRNRRFFWDKPHPEWKFFLATFFSQAAGTLASVYGFGTNAFVGIGWKYVGFSWIYIAIWFLLCALTKSGLYHLLDAKHFEKHFFSKIRKKL